MFFFAILFFLNNYGQTILTGKIQSANFPIASAEIINITQKKNVKSTFEGIFHINASINDEIIIYSKGYISYQMKVSNENLQFENTILLEKEPIAIEEIKIVRGPSMKIDVSYDALKTEQIYKQQSRPVVQGVYTGQIPNGMDFVAISGLVRKLFNGKEKDKKNKPIEFEKLVRYKVSNDFFVDKLKLEESEIDLFLIFCKNDKTSNQFSKESNELDIIDFLVFKRKEFK